MFLRFFLPRYGVSYVFSNYAAG